MAGDYPIIDDSQKPRVTGTEWDQLQEVKAA